MSELHKLKTDLEDAFNSIGLSMLSKHTACKLLAYVAIMGGGNEAVVYNDHLNSDILIAQKHLNLYGGEVPNLEWLPVLQQRLKELDDDMENCHWLPEIGRRYNLNIEYGTYVKPDKKPYSIWQKVFRPETVAGIDAGVDMSLLLTIFNNFK